jgi:hypothetical protein
MPSKVRRIEASAPIAAPPAVVYRLLADYRNGHPRILPPVFSNLEVEEGGVGAGTRIRFDMTLLGQRRTSHATIDEPEPGRVLAERDVATGTLTTFTVEPLAGEATRLTITTELRSPPGWRGRIENWLGARLLRGVYRDELARIAAVAPGWQG